MEDRLLLLTRFWYDYVGCDHHKDRDCHFYINKVWSYGKEPQWRIEHYGYMSELNDDTLYDTYSSALKALLDWLEDEIKSVYESIPDDWEDTKKYDYNYAEVVSVLKEYNLHKISYIKYRTENDPTLP